MNHHRAQGPSDVEVSQRWGARPSFDFLDRNGDGVIDRAEWDDAVRTGWQRSRGVGEEGMQGLKTGKEEEGRADEAWR